MLWTDGSGVFGNCSLCGIEATLFFSAGPVCSRFSAEACTILHAFCWSRQHLQVCHFSSFLLLSDSRSVFSIFPFTLISVRNCLLSSPVLSGYNGSPDTRFSQGTVRLMSWPVGECYLFPQQSFVVTLLSLVSTLVFSQTGGILSHVNSSTHKFFRFPPRNLCFYVMLTVFSLSFAATDAAFC